MAGSNVVEERRRRGSGFELRLERAGAYAALPPQPLAPGFDLLALSMEIPEARPPFDGAGGASQFRHRRCDLERVELALGEEGVASLLELVALEGSGLARLSLALRSGFAEGSGALEDGTPFTFKAALVAVGEQGVGVAVYEPRLYAPSSTPAVALSGLLARAAHDHLRPEGLVLRAEPLAPLLRRILPARGWKVPRANETRLSVAEIATGRLRVGWDRAAAAATAPPDPDLLSALEGARAFALPEASLAAGDLAAAREGYRALGPTASVHPFGAARLLALLAADRGSHAEALALATTVLVRRKDAVAARLARAQVYLARGEAGRAAADLAEVAGTSIRRGEESSALLAAEACIALGPSCDPAAVSRAVEIALALRREHLPALRALRALGERGDREALLRACRRLAAYAPDAREKADAHARLGALLVESDPTAARLHLDHALRLAPPEREVLAGLARTCEAAGDALRAVRALDRLRDQAAATGDRAGAAAAALEVADLWERAGQPENALLRGREACGLFPSVDAEARTAELAERLGEAGEAVLHYTRLVELLDPWARDAAARRAAAQRALARLTEAAGDHEAALGHLAAALACAPDDPLALGQLERVLGGLGRTRERRDALDRLAAASAEPAERMRALAEAARLSTDEPALARRRFEDLLEQLEGAEFGERDALRLEVLEGLAAAAGAGGDRAAERDALARLATLAPKGAARARALDRLAAAREALGDQAGALSAAFSARAEEASRERLLAELRLARASDPRRAADLVGELASLSEGREEAAPLLLERAALLAQANERALALEVASEAVQKDPARPEAHELLASLAAGQDPLLEARALLARAALARQNAEPEAAPRLAAAGQAALSAGLGEEGEAALHEALGLGLDPEEARAAFSSLRSRAVERDDAAAEERALEALVPLLPTPARPGALLRLSALALLGGEPARARAAAERARALAPRDPLAVEACRAAAVAEGDLAALPDLFAALAALDPSRAGELLLERARQLEELGRFEEADDALAQAVLASPPEAGLAAEHARQRRAHAAELPGRPWGEPLEAFARRTRDPLTAARALREAALAAMAQGDLSAALRCARGAVAHTPDDLSFAGPLLASLLYRQGAAAEVSPLLVRLFEAGLPGTEPKRGAELCRALAELSRERGEPAQELAALDRLLALEPHDALSALRRFEIDPDPARAVQALAAAAPATRVARLRSLCFARAAAAARRALSDPALADALFAKARTAAGDHPAALARVEEARVEALKAEVDPSAPYPPTELLDALRDLSAAREAAADVPGFEASLEELVDLHARHGFFGEAIRDLEKLEASAEARGDAPAAARQASRAGQLLLERSGDLERGLSALRRAIAHAPAQAAAWRALEAAGRTRGPEGSDTVLEALLGRLALEPSDDAARREAARLLLERDREDEARELLRDLVRRGPEGEEALEREMAERHAEWADACERRASTATGRERAELLRQAARARVGAGDDDGARAAARAAYDADPSDEVAFEGALRDARGDLARLCAVLESRARAVPAEAARHHRARAEALEAAGDLSGALGALEDLLAVEPADARVLSRVAEAKSARDGDLAAAAEDERLLELCAAGHPEATGEPEARARFRLGFAAAAQGREEAAVEHLGRALALAPDDPRARPALLHLSRSELTPPGLCEALLGLSRRLADAAQGEAARREALEAGARLSQRTGDRGPEAAGLLEALAALALPSEGDGDGEAVAERALDALLRQGENARATALMALAARTARGARRAAWLARLADAAVARGDFSAARAAREEALSADPTDAALRETHLADLEASGDPAALLRAVDLALSVAGADVPFLSLRRARALIALGDAPRAAESFLAAHELGPSARGWEETASALAALLEAGGEVAALARVEAARARVRPDAALRSAGLLAAAALFERAGELGSAGELARQARETAPDDAAPYLVEARLARASGDGEGAARALVGAAARGKGRPAAEAALEAARLFDGLGREDDAVAALEQATRAEPGSPEARRALAGRARARGDRELAARHLAALDPAELPAEERPGHQRALALALTAAGLPEAEAAWETVFHADPADPEAFGRLSTLALGQGLPDRWLALAAEHDGALSGRGEVARRRDLRCERAALLTDLGRFEAAEGAWQAALAMDPNYRPALHGLRALLERRGDHAGAADALDLEAKLATDPVEAAELLVDEARVHREQLRDRQRSLVVLAAAAQRLRGETSERAHSLLEHVEQIRAELSPGRSGGAAAPSAPAAGPGPVDHSTLPLYALAQAYPREPAASAPEEVKDDDPSPAADDRLRAMAEAAEGAERARLLDRLAGRLERRGERRGAALTTLEALDADPASEERFQRALALAGEDRPQVLAAHRLRARGAASPRARAEALRALGALLAESPESLPEAAEVLERASALWPESGAAAAALARVLIALGHFDRALGVLAPFERGAPDLPAAEAAELTARARQASEPAPSSAAAGLEDELEAVLRLARSSPGDRPALARLSALAGQLAAGGGQAARRLGLLARAASELEAFAAGTAPEPCAARPVDVGAEARARAAHPLATGALPRLIALLAPWLEGLFPADLARRGVSARHRVSTQRGPEILALLEEIGRALEARPVAAFLSDAEGFSVAVENTQPISLVLGGGFGGASPAQERRFLLARGLVLADVGFGLLGKFAPPDVGLLCDLACRFGGASPPAGAGLPPERARPFLEALERLVPSTTREQARALAPEGAQALAALRPRELVSALRQSASRVALLHAGCVHAALTGLLQGEPRLRGLPRDQALAHPDVRDLTAFAISEEGLALRAAAEELA